MPFVDTGEGRLHYVVNDQVPPWVPEPQTIVFHHGVAANHHLWAGWLARLSGRYRLLRIDMRGYGRSEAPTNDFRWSLDALMNDLDAVVNHAGVQRFHLVGESLGGTLAIAYALRSPERVLSLTASNAAVRGAQISNVHGWREIARENGQDGWAERMMSWRFHSGALAPEVHEWFLDVHRTCDLEITCTLADLLIETDLLPELGSIRAPTLLLSPDGSPFIKLELMAEMRDTIPDAELQVFAHARHGLPLSHGPACASVLAGFLARRFD